MILVLGGYGQVGARVSRQLENVIVAGRDEEKAKKFIKENQIHGIARRIDTSALKDADFCNVKTVVMCVESHNIDVLNKCILLGINYIDISPTTAVLKAIEAYREQIAQAGITVITGVGIAPGVSNLLAKKAAVEMDVVHEIDSYVMLGIGEDHGRNAVTWLLQNLYSKNPAIPSFTKTKCISLTRSKKKKEVIARQAFTRIDMADTIIMGRFHPEAVTRTWFAYDVNWITRAVCLLKRMGFFRSVNQPDPKKRETAQRQMSSLLSKELKVAKLLHVGTDEYSIQLHVCGEKNKKRVERTYVTYGNCNSNLTAYVTAEAAKRIGTLEKGLHYLEEVMDLDGMKIPVVQHKGR